MNNQPIRHEFDSIYYVIVLADSISLEKEKRMFVGKEPYHAYVIPYTDGISLYSPTKQKHELEHKQFNITPNFLHADKFTETSELVLDKVKLYHANSYWLQVTPLTQMVDLNE